MAEDWDRLAAHTDPKSVFLKHAWFFAAWQWRRNTGTLCILCVNRAGSPIGILPMINEQRRSYGLPVRVLCALDLPDTQQFSLLCMASDASVVADAIAAELMRTSRVCDQVQLTKLHDTQANAAMHAALAKWPRITVSNADTCPCAPLRGRWEDYYSRRSRRLKKGNNLIANRLKNNFATLELARVTVDSSAAGTKVLDQLCALSAASWKRTLPTCLHMPGPRAWIDQLRRAPSVSGALVAWCLRLDGVLAAAEIQLDYGGTISALRADTHEGYDKHSVGTYLGWKVLENMMGKQHEIYNMGPGLSEYKARWAESHLDLTVLTAYTRTLAGSVLWIIEQRLRPLVRRLAGLLSRGQQP